MRSMSKGSLDHFNMCEESWSSHKVWEARERIEILAVLQLYYGLVVIYYMVYHYTKRVILARLLANQGPAIYVVYWTDILLYFHNTI